MADEAPKLNAAREVAHFSIGLTRYLDSDGVIAHELPVELRDASALTPIYRAMTLTRIFDEKAVALQRTGRLGTYASSLGQEGVSVGVASAMRTDDVLLPSFREQGAMLWRGVTMTELLAYWGGDERGSNFSGPREDFPICVPVATQFPQAAGVALALQLRGEERAAVVIGGDGSSSKGDFYEAMNFAGVWRLPLVFVINNNQWAISVPRSAQSAAQTLAQKAVAAGIPGEQVDGNDAIAVHAVMGNALERARGGGGATVIEALTYRLSDHTTADDARRYRSSDEVSRHWKHEPISRLRAYLVAQGVWDKAAEVSMLAQCRSDVEAAADAYLKRENAPATDMIDYLHETPPAALQAQRAELAGERSGKDA